MTRGTPSRLRLRAPPAIPVVMAAIGEAVETGVVASIAHPGGNITGLSGYMLLMVGPSNAINATLYDKLNFNFVRDIAPVAPIVRFPSS